MDEKMEVVGEVPEVGSTGSMELFRKNAVLVIAVAIVLGASVLAGAYVYVETQRDARGKNIDAWALPPRGIEEYEQPRVSEPEASTASVKTPTETQNRIVSPDEYPKFIEDTRDYSMYYGSLVKQDGVSWLPKPEPVGLRDLVTYQTADYASYEQVYFRIGTYFDKEILFTLVPCDGPCSDNLLLFVGSLATGYELVKKHSVYDVGCTEDCSYRLRDGVAINTTLSFDAFSVPETYATHGASVEDGNMWSNANSVQPEDFFVSKFGNILGYGNRYDAVEFVTDTPYGPLFQGEHSILDGYTVRREYGIRLPGGLIKSLGYAQPAFVNDDGSPRIEWLSGEKNTAPYTSRATGGCGAAGPEIVIAPFRNTDLALAGYLESGEPIYNLTNPEHPLIERIFEMTGGKYYEYVNGGTKEITFTPEELIADHGVIVYTDAFQTQLVYTNAKYGPQAECAKPVIYLYPEATTTISVSVDARVTKSEPVYANGWTAIASRDGSLMVNGASYESLFWDGYGRGMYPTFTEGFVVKTEDALALMDEHLTRMGFNEKEISDFNLFWEPHLPKTPYTQFSWIGTQGMERLAKLTIDPKPDTLIRAFVDFVGLETSVNIAPQTIPTYKRKGYVVTEWGGLLRK